MNKNKNEVKWSSGRFTALNLVGASLATGKNMMVHVIYSPNPLIYLITLAMSMDRYRLEPLLA